MTDSSQNEFPGDNRQSRASGQGPVLPKSPKEALRPEKVPQPPRRSRRAHSQLVIFLNFLMSLAVGVCVIAVIGFYYVMRTYQADGPLATNAHFVVRNGAGLAEIAGNLERSGIVSDARIFRYVTASYQQDGETLKAGEYEVKAHASMKEVMDLLQSGKSILYAFTMPEGLTVKQTFLKLTGDTMLEGPMPKDVPAEGTLRPDTYKFTRGTARAEIVDQMLAAQAKLIDDVWARRDPDLPIKDKNDFVTLASIVEKETGKDDERAHVASVFLNRLNKGMRLQSDPTVIYGLFGGDGKPSDRPIYQSDLKKETPYNTYVIKGLPPGPICNPGKAALEAVAQPWKSDDLYFVADGTGGHVFASSLKEHNENVQRWRRLVKERNSNDDVVDGQPGGDDAATSN